MDASKSTVGMVKSLWLMLVGLTLALFTVQQALSAPEVVSADHRVTVTYSKPQFDSKKGIYTTQMRIRNNSAAALFSPLRISFDAPALGNFRIVNAHTIGKDGRPYFEVKLPKGMLPPKTNSGPVNIIVAPGKEKSAKSVVLRLTTRLLGAAQRVSAGVEVAPLGPRAEPYALKAGTGKTNVRFSVRVVGQPKPDMAVYIRMQSSRGAYVMNDAGKEGDLVAKDGIYGVNVVVDADKLKPDTCLGYVAALRLGKTEIASNPYALCASAYPVRLSESKSVKTVELPGGGRAVADELLLTVISKTKSDVVRRLAAVNNATIVGNIPALNLYQLRLVSALDADRLIALVNKLKGYPGVRSVSVNAIGGFTYTPTDPEFASQHGLQLVRADDAWDIGATGGGETIVVLDSGLDRTHADFGIPGNCQLAANNCGGANTDGLGHGTQVAGVVGALTNNALGVAGVAHGGKIHPIQVSPDAAVTDTEMIQGFTDTEAYGLATVINASFSTLNAFVDWTPVCAAINSAVLNAGVPVAIVINAAGNNNANGNYYPARCNDLNAGLTRKDLLITVANSASIVTAECGSVAVDQRCNTSNYGAWVDLTAPGSSIRTTTLGNAYSNPSGTSFSSPMVAGAAAILKSCGIPLDQIESTLRTSANVTVTFPGGSSAPRLDIFRALHVNAPTASNLSAAETYTEDTPRNLTNIVVTDSNGCAAVTATLTLSNVAAGTLTTATSGTVTSTFAGGVWTASGPLADVNALLAGVTFNPAPNFNVGFNIGTSVSDGFSPAVAGTKVISGIAVNDAPGGLPTISGTVTEDQTLSASAGGITDEDGLGAFNYQWLRNGAAIGGANSSTYNLVDADVGQAISVRVSYVDGSGNAENVTSIPTAAVGNINDLPMGLPVISGGASEDQLLAANAGGISDADGLGAFSYQWLRGGANMPGANVSTYTLVDVDVGQTISVRVSYMDGWGTAENVTSIPTAVVINANDPPVGLPVITGLVAEDQTLTADTVGITDEDGLGTFSYQWLRGGAAIGGATGSTYILVEADVGQTISVRVSYTDGHGTAENATSDPTVAVINVNDAPVGIPVIDPPDASGNRNEGQILSALTGGISDEDGLGVFHYQWSRDGTDVGTDSDQYTLQNTDLGGHMKVCVSYTDGHMTLENICSANDATAVGDPHILTVDGLRYDFQGAGEFVALRGANGMEIQLRMEAVSTAPPLPDDYTGLSSGVSVNTAIAARVGKQRVSYQPDTGPNAVAGTFVLRVDGVVTTLPVGGVDLVDGGRVLPQTSGGIQIDFPDQTTLMVNTSSWPFYGAHWLHVSVFHTPAYDGLMGARSKGSWLPRLSDGTAFGPKPASLNDRYVELYEKFADSWRVNKDISLFDYVDDTSMVTFTNKKWPTEKGPYAAANGPVAQPLPRKAAELACREVVGKIEKANCVFDVRVMGHKDLAKGHLLNQKIRLGAVNVIVRPAGKLNARGEMVVAATVVRHAAVVPKVKGIRKVPAGTIQFMLGDKTLGKPVRLDAKGQARVVVTRQDMERFRAGKQAITARYLPTRDKANVFLPGVSKRLTRELVPTAIRAGAVVGLPRRLK